MLALPLRKNPFRPVDWRWLRAHAIQDGSAPPLSRQRDGNEGYKWISDVMSYTDRYSECRNNNDLSILSEDYPDLFWAHSVYLDNITTNRYSIEANILARVDNLEIARRMGMEPSTINAYEKVFFNVKEKLDNTQYIMHTVINLHKNMTDNENMIPDFLWKLFAYLYGPVVLNCMERLTVNPIWCTDPENAMSAIRDDAAGTLHIKTAIAAKTTKVNARTQLALMEVFNKFVEISQDTDSGGGAQSSLAAGVENLMRSISLEIGRNVPEQHGPLRVYHTAAAELSYNETIRTSVGYDVDEAPEILGLTFDSAIAANELVEEHSN